MKGINYLFPGLGLLLLLIAFSLDRVFKIHFAYASYLYIGAILLFLASYFLRRRR